MNIPFIDLHGQYDAIGSDRIKGAIERVLEHGGFISGPEVKTLEHKLAEFAGYRHCVSCGNGTDALYLAMLAEEIGPGDAVFVPSFSFVATAEIIPLVGATPIFVDIDERTYNISVDSLELAVEKARELGLKPRAVIAVDLFGLAADYPTLTDISNKHDLTLISDSAQGFGSRYPDGDRQRPPLMTTSFFPAKPLGCYGDGGAIFTDNDDAASLIRSLCVHGKGDDKYDNVRIGVNSRLDTMQAAILLEKLSVFADEINARNMVADRYTNALSDLVVTPVVPEAYVSVWAQYTIRVPNRSDFMRSMKDAGVPTAVYYPIPLHLQKGYVKYPRAQDKLPIAERVCEEVISLPMHPYLGVEQQQHIIDSVRASLAGVSVDKRQAVGG